MTLPSGPVAAPASYTDTNVSISQGGSMASGRVGLDGLSGIHVVELGGEAAARAGRVLADLGARVTRVSPAGRPDGVAARRAAWIAWTHGKNLVTLDDGG